MKTDFVTPHIRGNALETWRANVFANIIRVIAYAGTITYFVLIGFLFDKLETVFFIAYTVAYLLVLAAAFATRIALVYRAFTVVLLLYLLGIFSTIERAAMGDARVWFITAAIFAAVFLGRRAGLAFTILGTLTWGAFGLLFAFGYFPEPEFEQFTWNIWGGTTVTLLMASLSTVLSIGALLINLNQTVDEGVFLAKTAEKQSAELAEQHNALERRSNALERSVSISRRVASLTSAENILLQAPIMIKNDFNLLSVAFFELADDSLLYLASCEGWNDQAHPKHDYAVALEDDITGAAVIKGEAISNNTSEKGLRATLPDTRSFASIPMRGRSSNITGTLLLQSEDFEGLGAEQLSIFQMLADQVAILMENARLLAEKESALEAERRAYGDITESAWVDFMQNRNFGGYLRDEEGLRSIPAKQYHPEEDSIERYQVPIQLRGRVIGHIDARKTEKRPWTVSERELMNTLSGRLENALDSARLYEEIQERAAREHVVSEASSRMRESLDVQAVLKAAAEELHKALGGVAETEIWIAPDDIDDEPVID